MLPNLICSGAAKCGTTSLHEYLGSHPEIFMAHGKELNFFTGPEWNWRHGLEWYSAQFPVQAPVRGETSHTYTNHPFATGVPQRIESTLGRIKLLYIVSDPVERLISDWVGEYANGHENLTFDALVASPYLEQTGYVARGRYAHQLSVFLEVFSHEELKVVSRDALSARPGAVMADLFAFLGVDAGFRSPALGTVHNPSAPKRRDRRAAPLIRKLPGARSAERRAKSMSGWGGKLMRAPFSRRIERPVPSPSQRERLRECFAEDAARLRELTGLSLAEWSV